MSAYYNEFDPFAAQWLRELIKAGHIAQGDVDDRSILDVSAADLRGYDQCHFFAGIGVWSYSLRRAGWSDDRPVWTGSCPCQPLSVAGLGKGHADSRHLWPAFHRLIAECRPSVVLGEQVAGKDGREWFSAVRADLEGDGYACGGADLCAAGVGAPHIRQRLYWLAHADRQQWNGSGHAGAGRRREPADDSSAVGLADAAGGGREPRPGIDGVQAGEVRNDALPEPRPDGGAERLADTGHDRPQGRLFRGPDAERQTLDRPAGRDGATGGGLEHPAGNGRLERRAEPGQRGAVGGRVTGGMADTCGSTGERNPGAVPPAQARLDGEGIAVDGRDPVGHCDGGPDGGLADAGCERGGATRPASGSPQPGADLHDQRRGANGGLADADRDRRGEGRLSVRSGRQEQAAPVEQRHGEDGRPGAPDTYWSDADWLYCRDGRWRPVEPGTFPLATGSPARVGRLRGYGNAINAETAKAFIESVMDLA